MCDENQIPASLTSNKGTEAKDNEKYTVIQNSMGNKLSIKQKQEKNPPPKNVI